MSDTQKQETPVPPLYQVNPDVKSVQSYQFLASRNSVLLRRNGRIPTHQVAIEFRKVHPPNEIMNLRSRIFRYMGYYNEIEAIVRIALSKSYDEKPDNRVYFHILTDCPENANSILHTFHSACWHNDLVLFTDYWIEYSPIFNGKFDFDAFTGCDRKVILFRKELRIKEYYEIGKWYHKPKTVLWQEVIDCVRKGQSIDPNGK